MSAEQKQAAARFGALYVPPGNTERVGIALATLSKVPLNALRHPPENGTCESASGARLRGRVVR